MGRPSGTHPSPRPTPHTFTPTPTPTLPTCRAIDALACPAGFYCPTPAAALPCEPGYFCPPATIQPVTCNMTLLVEAAPLMPITFRPATVAQRVFMYGDPLQGNSCPANASDPIGLCPKGWYCPDPAVKLPCPAGFYCKSGSLQPQRCPFLTNCPAGACECRACVGLHCAA